MTIAYKGAEAPFESLLGKATTVTLKDGMNIYFLVQGAKFSVADDDLLIGIDSEGFNWQFKRSEVEVITLNF